MGENKDLFCDDKEAKKRKSLLTLPPSFWGHKLIINNNKFTQPTGLEGGIREPVFAANLVAELKQFWLKKMLFFAKSLAMICPLVF